MTDDGFFTDDFVEEDAHWFAAGGTLRRNGLCPPADRVVQQRREGHLDQEDGYDCPICRNKGYLRVVTEEGGIPNAWMRPCQCQKVRQSIRQMRRSGLQHIIQDYTFAKFQATEPWQQKLKAAAQAYAQSLEGWFFFGGQSGSGKTHLCTAICRKALHQGRQVRYMLWRDDVSRIKAVANQGEEYNAAIAPISTRSCCTSTTCSRPAAASTAAAPAPPRQT